ncbi:hypothetical protein ACQJZ4_14040 [Bacillus altitudinis]
MAKPRSKGSKHTHASVLFLMAKQHPKAAQHLLKTFGLLWRM